MSLKSESSHGGNQGETWEEIEKLHRTSGSSHRSRTRAISDFYNEIRKDMEDAKKQYPVVPDQAGLIVLVDGEVTGCDLLSRPEAYKDVHKKLSSVI